MERGKKAYKVIYFILGMEREKFKFDNGMGNMLRDWMWDLGRWNGFMGRMVWCLVGRVS